MTLSQKTPTSYTPGSSPQTVRRNKHLLAGQLTSGLLVMQQEITNTSILRNQVGFVLIPISSAARVIACVFSQDATVPIWVPLRDFCLVTDQGAKEPEEDQDKEM